jgi:phosphoribosyl 1,2-cyclic phosphodiesterase
MRITFWGVRGSIPTPGPNTVEIGGNTSCVEVRVGKTILIFDAGTGLRVLGQKLLEEMPVEAHLFFSHVHWDHIQGFPFFAPAFVAGNTFHLYGGTHLSRTLEETMAGQMENPSFPVHLSAMAASMTFSGLHDGQTLVLGPDKVQVTWGTGNHPQGVLCYRITHGGKSIVYATDTEHYAVADPNIVRLSKGADILVHDAQYTPEEYAGTANTGGPKNGWGHSTFDAATEIAKAAGVRKLVLYHHDPGQTDVQVRDKERRARELFPESIAAYEGLTLEI